MQRVPYCFGCGEQVVHDPIFEAPCGHEDHASAVFHGICLMEWREHREERQKREQEMYAAFLAHVNGECSCPPKD